MALDSKDIEQIRSLITEGIEELILPKFDQVNARLDGVDRRLEKVDATLADLRSNQADLIDTLQGKKILTKQASSNLRSRLFGRSV